MASTVKLPSIYGLYDRDGALRYIGKANDPEQRLIKHMAETRRRKTPLYNWLNKHGLPGMKVLEADCIDWKESERRLIAEARARGERLLNVADGGDEPFCTNEQRRERLDLGRPKAIQAMRNWRQGLNSDGSVPTFEDNIIFGYDLALKIAYKRDQKETGLRIVCRMSERYREDPVSYKRWANWDVLVRERNIVAPPKAPRSSSEL